MEGLEGLVYLLIGVIALFLICMIQQEQQVRRMQREINRLELEKGGFEIVEPSEVKSVETFDEKAFEEEYDELVYNGKHCS